MRGARVGRTPWLSVVWVAAVAALSLTVGADRGLAYERERVARGEAWRLVTAQHVKPAGAVGWAALGVAAACGVWLERRQRWVWLAAVGLGLLFSAAALEWAGAGEPYAGLGSPVLALGVAALLEWTASAVPPRRWWGVAALAGLALLVAWGVWAGAPLRGLAAWGAGAERWVQLGGALGGLAGYWLAARSPAGPPPPAS